MSGFADRFTTLIDACVLSGALRRNMLLSLAEVGMFRPRWSERILDETERAISKVTEGEVGAEQRTKIEEAFPESLVTNYEVFEAQLALPDPDDVHVLAAAIATSAAVIVTDNLRHFPDAVLAPHNIGAISADSFIANTIELDMSEALSALQRMRNRFVDPALDVEALIRKAEAQGLAQVATIMNESKSLL